ncbi:MAG: carbon-nitrogen hydrolase family protein [Nocardiaceae bacterium]|nr:carbon-nitrogen hydrolase family protein [Nocardiaceae bacterium]
MDQVDRLTVAVAQPESSLGNIASNVASHEASIRRAHSRLIVFPEMSLTGYSMNVRPIDVEDDRLTPLMEACRTADSVALVGAPVAVDSGGIGIGVLAVTSQSIRVAYVKASLGGDEPNHFTRGTAPGMVEIDGWRVGIGVCKDTRIAEHLDQTASLGLDLYVAGLVHAPREFNELHDRAHRIARTYGIPVAFAACAGPAGGAFPQTSGGSGVWDRSGSPIQQLGATPNGLTSVMLRSDA